MKGFYFVFFSVTRTFASGKTEKIIFTCLKDLGLPFGKVTANINSLMQFFLFILILERRN